MYVSSSELHLRRARTLEDSRSAIEEYMLAITEAVREMKEVRPSLRTLRRR